MAIDANEQRIAELERQLAEECAARTAVQRELAQAPEQQTATSEILRVLNRAPTSLEPVLDAILDNALRLCASPVGLLFLYDGATFRLVADRGVPPALAEPRRRAFRTGP